MITIRNVVAICDQGFKLNFSSVVVKNSISPAWPSVVYVDSLCVTFLNFVCWKSGRATFHEDFAKV